LLGIQQQRTAWGWIGRKSRYTCDGLRVPLYDTNAFGNTHTNFYRDPHTDSHIDRYCNCYSHSYHNTNTDTNINTGPSG
jgi:hypothetical protein